MADKPSGIVLLAILYGLEALCVLGIGGLLVIGGGFVGLSGSTLGGGILAGFGAILILVGLFMFIITYGLWTLKPWARMFAIIFAVLGLLAFPIGTILSIIILWYLFKPEIKAAFH